MVFAKTFFRFANRADDFRAQILFAADPVVNFFCERIVKKPVHGEIAAQRVGFGVCKNNFFRTATVLVIRLGAKSGDLELMSAFDDDHHAEFFARRRWFVLKSFSTCSGFASVAMSKSCGSRPSKKSRTQPPTQNAAKTGGFVIAACTRFLISTANGIQIFINFYSFPQINFRCAMPHLTASTGSDGLNSKTLMCSGFTNGLSAAKSIVPVPGAQWSRAGNCTSWT